MSDARRPAAAYGCGVTRSRLFTLIATVSCVTALAACGDDEDEETPVAAPPLKTATAEPAPAPADTAAPAADGECKEVEPAEAKEIDTPKPTGKLPTGKSHVVTMQTSCGLIEITLDAKNNPKTANSFAALTKDKVYDNTGFLRVVPGFVIQGGDPSGTQSGGPDWQVVEKPSKDSYARGDVAMAKAGNDPPGASGSQFFIMLADDNPLPPEYAIAGKVTKGMEVADAIVGLAAPGVPDGPPVRAANVETATLK